MSAEVIEVREFLSQHHPFDLLPPDDLVETAKAIEIAYVRKGNDIALPGKPFAHLCVVRSGAVESHSPDGQLLARLGEGECFGVRALLRGGIATTRTFAIEDCLLYMLPVARFDALRRAHPAFAYYFAAFDGGSLGASIDSLGGKTFDLLSRRIGDLLTRAPITVPISATIRETAAVMRDQRVSAAMVVEGEDLVGIVTDRDLRGRVVAAGVPVDDPVQTVMSPSPIHVEAQDLAFNALLTMSRHNFHHLPVMDKGKLRGCLTASTLIDTQANSPLYLARAIHKATSADELPSIVARVPQVVNHFVQAGATAHAIGMIVSAITDAVTHALLNLAEARFGPPPVPYVWLVAGSQGRQEQTALSDQDNCLLLDDTYDPLSHGDYFAAFAAFVTDALHACGYIYCPGEMMARTPRWRQPLAVWKRYFSGWIEEPEPKALMLSCIFFDMRPLGGATGLWDDLHRTILAKSRKNRIFLAHMGGNAMQHQPPIGFFRNFVLSEEGAHDNVLNLKRNGVVPIVDLARIHALSVGLEAVNTEERLDGAAEARAISHQGAMDLKDALEFIGITRLRHQARQIRAGLPADNYLKPEELSSFERGNLKSAFQVVKDMQAALASAYQLGRF